MPLYDYRCSSCHEVTEVRHGFGETFSGACPHCGAKLNRVFNPAPIVFKGSGFYVTDSRGKSSNAGDTAKESSNKETPSKEAPSKEAAGKEASTKEASAKEAPPKEPAKKPASDPAA